MNMVPTSTAHQSSSLPRPPAPPGPGSVSTPISGPHHPAVSSHQAVMNHSGPYGHSHHSHQPQQQSHAMGPGVGVPNSYPMPSQSPSPRGVPPGMNPGQAHPNHANINTPGSVSGAQSPYHHPLHSPAAANVNGHPANPHNPHHVSAHHPSRHSQPPHHSQHPHHQQQHQPHPSHHPQMLPHNSHQHAHSAAHHTTMGTGSNGAGGHHNQHPPQQTSQAPPSQQQPQISGVPPGGGSGPPPHPHYNRQSVHSHYGQPQMHPSQAGSGNGGGSGGGNSSNSMAPHPSQHSSSNGGGGGSAAAGGNGLPRSSSSSTGSNSKGPSYLPRYLNGNWQSDNDMSHRRVMIQQIVQLLKQRDKNSSQEWLNKLPQMVKQLEVSLYRSAESFEAYADTKTLKKRLQSLAFEISKKTQGGSSSNKNSSAPQPPPSSSSSVGPSDHTIKKHRQGSVGGERERQYRNGSSNRNQSSSSSRRGSESPYERRSSHDAPYIASSMQARSSPARSSGQVVNMNEINPMMVHSSGPRSSSSVGSGSRRNIPSGSGTNSVSSYTNGNQNDPDWKIRIKHKQQRLLLLYHSSKCQYKENCPHTQHCADMKKLWAHMAKCSDPHCRVPHCYSSRSILSHYRKCKDNRCPACGPVREAVKNPTSLPGAPPSQSGSGRRTPQDRSPTAPPFDRPIYRAKRVKTETISSKGVKSESPHSRSSESQDQRQHIDGKIRHKQQRLLLLKHASKCTVTDGKCKVTPHCAEMKKLWKHISTCQDRNCKVDHCHSSRVVLSHYRKCKDMNCPSCAPVREKNYDLKPQSSDDTNLPSRKRPRIPPDMCVAIPPSKLKEEVEKTIPPTKGETPKRSEETSTSLINSFTIEQIELHLQSLNRTNQLPIKDLKEKFSNILKTLSEHEHWWVFGTPVDADALNLADYFDIIKKPMDLGTVSTRVQAGHYHSIEDFSADVRLTFDNAMTYNEKGSVVHDMAIEVKKEFMKLYDDLMEKLRKEEEERRKNDKACHLCGVEKLQFEPPVFFCNSLNCTSKRIHRNRHFYVGGNNQYFWCHQCYNQLDENQKIEMPDLTMTKSELKKKKNDEQHEENWVQCDTCEKWIHQICGLFNSRQNKDKLKYSCPQCLRDEMKAGTNSTKTNLANAEQLPRTNLSEWLEHSVRTRVVDEYKRLAEEKAELEKIPFEEAHKIICDGGNITIRQVASTDRKLEVRERMRRRYAHKNYPEEFPYRCKCIVVFQNLDGVDVVLFALYVYEHNEKNPAPNQRTVYISYLDSVHFMRPRSLRTFVYHEILISYLDYARRRGFATAHIWACPPLKGDDYIFYAKPEDQKTPKDNRLRQWYVDMLEESQRRDIVGKVTNMHDLYFSNKSLDATAVPYLEGDYFCGEAENIIKDLEDGKGGKGGTSGKKSKKKKNSSGNNVKAKSKSKNGRKGTRSGGIEEIDTKESSSKGGDQIPERDPVMARLGETIQPMKDSFIVAFLNWEGAKPENLVVPDDIKEYREKVKKEKELTGDSSKKRDSDGNSREITLESMAARDVRDSKGNRVKVVDDDVEELDCEILNNRQAFLNLCRGNHYQFDQLRRAKHTSMMVLWHLHNRDAAKFVQVCACCAKEILSGNRYTCTTCSDYDLCEDCYKNPNTNRGACTHELVAKPVEGDNSQSGKNSSQLTAAQSEERQRNIRLHIQLLEHASTCNSPTCQSSNCKKMKNYLKHSRECPLKMAGGCKICKRIWTLLRYHANSCKNNSCSIPQCLAIRERLRQLAKQQQAMDDRRRQVMNRQYRMGAMS